jgi:hypothetical protein
LSKSRPRRLFSGEVPATSFRLVDATTTDTGVVVLTYATSEKN